MSPSWVSYGVSIVSILAKNDRIITAPYCLCMELVPVSQWTANPPSSLAVHLYSQLITGMLSVCWDVCMPGVFYEGLPHPSIPHAAHHTHLDMAYYNVMDGRLYHSS